MVGEKIVNGLSSKENVSDKHEWVKNEVKAELTELQESIFFYENSSQDPDKIKYNMDAVKSYLSKLSSDISDKSVKDAWSYLTKWRHQYAWVMAVQIALESLPSEYDTDVHKIDWLLWGPNSATRNAVTNFQKKRNETHDGKHKIVPDGLPGKSTINALLEVINWIENSNNKPDNIKKSDDEIDGENKKNLNDKNEEALYDEVTVIGYSIDIPWKNVEVEASNLLRNVPEWATVEFVGKGISKKWAEEQIVDVVVKKGEERKRKMSIRVKIKNWKITAEENKENKEYSDKVNHYISVINEWDNLSKGIDTLIWQFYLSDTDSWKLQICDRAIVKLREMEGLVQEVDKIKIELQESLEHDKKLFRDVVWDYPVWDYAANIRDFDREMTLEQRLCRYEYKSKRDSVSHMQ